MSLSWLFLALVVAALLWAVKVFNGLVALRHRMHNAFAQIDVQCQRRYELIPNLVEAVHAYLQHEHQTLVDVVTARQQASQCEQHASVNPVHVETLERFARAEGQLEMALGRLLAIAENYPDLKADQRIAALMEDLRTTENRVSFARQSFNDGVMSYNIARERFPDTLIATLCGFHVAAALDIPVPEARQPLRISLN